MSFRYFLEIFCRHGFNKGFIGCDVLETRYVIRTYFVVSILCFIKYYRRAATIVCIFGLRFAITEIKGRYGVNSFSQVRLL